MEKPVEKFVEPVALFAIFDHVTKRLESYGCYSGSPQAARVLVALYGFSPNPAISKRLSDYDLVQLTELFDALDTDETIKHIYINWGSLSKIKSEFDRRDGVFELPEPF